MYVVDAQQAGDVTVLSGEIGGPGGKLLETLATELSVVYEPTFRESTGTSTHALLWADVLGEYEHCGDAHAELSVRH